jgi:hypothetical protein
VEPIMEKRWQDIPPALVCQQKGGSSDAPLH